MQYIEQYTSQEVNFKKKLSSKCKILSFHRCHFSTWNAAGWKMQFEAKNFNFYLADLSNLTCPMAIGPGQ
jgi:hypothetical protein